MTTPYFSVGGPDVHRVTVVALYDGGTGDVAHTHVVVQLEGGRPVDEAEATDAARRNAAAADLPVDSLDVALSDSFAHAATPHRIDLATGAFVPLEVEQTIKNPAGRRASS